MNTFRSQKSQTPGSHAAEQCRVLKRIDIQSKQNQPRKTTPVLRQCFREMIMRDSSFPVRNSIVMQVVGGCGGSSAGGLTNRAEWQRAGGRRRVAKICRTIARLSSLSLIAVLMMAGSPARLAAKELCWEECTFELMGGCWNWKKACLEFSVDDRGRLAAPESYDRSPSRQPIPSQIDSLLSGGGLSTALNLEGPRTHGQSQGHDLLDWRD